MYNSEVVLLNPIINLPLEKLFKITQDFTTRIITSVNFLTWTIIFYSCCSGISGCSEYIKPHSPHPTPPTWGMLHLAVYWLNFLLAFYFASWISWVQDINSSWSMDWRKQVPEHFCQWFPKTMEFPAQLHQISQQVCNCLKTACWLSSQLFLLARLSFSLLSSVLICFPHCALCCIFMVNVVLSGRF